MGRSSSCSSSTIESSSINPHQNTDFLVTDLSLGLGNFDYTTPMEDSAIWERRISDYGEENESKMAALFVKVYMEGIPIGRKLNLVAHDGYHALIRTLAHMFSATILWADVEIVNSARYHVLTYEDKEGDWLIVGDVPWEMFLTSVKRLKITRADRF